MTNISIEEEEEKERNIMISCNQRKEEEKCEERRRERNEEKRNIIYLYCIEREERKRKRNISTIEKKAYWLSPIREEKENGEEREGLASRGRKRKSGEEISIYRLEEKREEKREERRREREAQHIMTICNHLESKRRSKYRRREEIMYGERERGKLMCLYQ